MLRILEESMRPAVRGVGAEVGAAGSGGGGGGASRR